MADENIGLVAHLAKQPALRPIQLRARARNWEVTMELGALLQCAFADGGVGGEFFVNLGAVVRSRAEEQHVFVDEPAGLVIRLDPGPIDLAPVFVDGDFQL